MSTEELQNRIDASAELSALRDRVATALTARSENQYTFSPILIISIISLMIQVVQYCRQKRSDDEIAADIKNVRNLPPRKLMRFKRRANVLWKEYCAEHGIAPGTVNPILDAAYSLGADTSDAAIAELIALAK